MEVENFEAVKLKLKRLTDYQSVATIELPFRVSFNNYINNILQLNVHRESDVKLNPWMILGIALDSKENRTAVEQLDELRKNLHFNLVNGFREILRTIQDSNTIMQIAFDEYLSSNSVSYFEILMIFSITLTIVSLVLVSRELYLMTRTKNKILNIFSLLSNEEIKKVYDICDMFLDQFENGGY